MISSTIESPTHLPYYTIEMKDEQQGKQYDEYLQFAIDLAKQASEIIKAGQKKRNLATATSTTKSAPLDFLTETDLAVENFIKKGITEKYPEHKLYA